MDARSGDNLGTSRRRAWCRLTMSSRHLRIWWRQCATDIVVLHVVAGVGYPHHRGGPSDPQGNGSLRNRCRISQRRTVSGRDRFPTGTLLSSQIARRGEWEGFAPEWEMVRRFYKNRTLGGAPGRGFKHTIKIHQTGRRVAVPNPDGPKFIDCPHLAHVDLAELDAGMHRWLARTFHFAGDHVIANQNGGVTTRTTNSHFPVRPQEARRSRHPMLERANFGQFSGFQRPIVLECNGGSPGEFKPWASLDKSMLLRRTRLAITLKF
jgi:hypothetical protein